MKTHQLGKFTFTGKTKTEAKKAFETALVDYCLDPGVHIENRFGSIFIIWRDLNGFNVRTIWGNVDEAAFVHGTAYTLPSCGMAGFNTRQEVIQSCRMHCAQNHWAPDIDDELHARSAALNDQKTREFIRWATFQRDYSKHIAAGHDKDTAWRMANNLTV